MLKIKFDLFWMFDELVIKKNYGHPFMYVLYTLVFYGAKRWLKGMILFQKYHIHVQMKIKPIIESNLKFLIFH
jgi:hypothetical protein